MLSGWSTAGREQESGGCSLSRLRAWLSRAGGWSESLEAKGPEARCGHKPTGSNLPSRSEEPSNPGGSGPKTGPPCFPARLIPQPRLGALGGGQAPGWTCLPRRGFCLFLLGSLKLTVCLGPQAGPVGRCPMNAPLPPHSPPLPAQPWPQQRPESLGQQQDLPCELASGASGFPAEQHGSCFRFLACLRFLSTSLASKLAWKQTGH